MPELGEIKIASQVGIAGGSRYIWQACPGCGKERWVQLSKVIRQGAFRCRTCTRAGARNANWKGGRRVDKTGYVVIWISVNDPYYSMAVGNKGYLHEHRLVMARSLGRPLLPSEQVHHKNGIKDDNRIENLELMPDARSHIKMSVCVHCDLRKEIRLLRWQIKEQSEQIKQLTGKLMGI